MMLLLYQFIYVAIVLSCAAAAVTMTADTVAMTTVIVAMTTVAIDTSANEKTSQ